MGPINLASASDLKQIKLENDVSDIPQFKQDLTVVPLGALNQDQLSSIVANSNAQIVLTTQGNLNSNYEYVYIICTLPRLGNQTGGHLHSFSQFPSITYFFVSTPLPP